MEGKKTLTAERRREILEKELQGNMRLIDSIRTQIRLYEEDIIGLRNKRYKIEHEISVIEEDK